MDCIFCKIANGEIPSTKVYEDETVVAFNDLEPQAPTHILVIPKEHISSADEVTEENSKVIAHIFEVIAKLSKEFPFVRVDFYCIDDGSIRFGEMTFTPASGSCPWAGEEDISLKLGAMIELPKKD